MKSLFRCHFLINATNKVVAGYSMRRGKVCFLGSFLPPSLPSLWSFLFSISSHVTLFCILHSLISSGRWCPQDKHPFTSSIVRDIFVIQLSLVLRPPPLIMNTIKAVLTPIFFLKAVKRYVLNFCYFPLLYFVKIFFYSFPCIF